MQPETDFDRQMQIVREVMDKKQQALRALADLDRTGSCTIDGQILTEAELRGQVGKAKAISD